MNYSKRRGGDGRMRAIRRPRGPATCGRDRPVAPDRDEIGLPPSRQKMARRAGHPNGSLAGPGGTTRTQDARRRAEPSHALRRRPLLRRQVPEQSAAHPGAGQRLAGHAAGRDDRPAHAGGRGGGRASLAGGTHARPAHRDGRPAADVHRRGCRSARAMWCRRSKARCGTTCRRR